MATSSSNGNNGGEKQRKSNWWVRLWRAMAQGRFLSLAFFKKYGVYILGIVLMFLAYISNKFECQKQMQDVMNLKTELVNAQTDLVNASAKYNSLIRESQMTDLVRQQHIDLQAPDQPPYQLRSK